MVKPVAYLLLYLLFQVYSQQSNNTYLPDQDVKQNISETYPLNHFEIPKESDSNRNIQTTSPQPIRISVDYSNIYQMNDGIYLMEVQKTIIKNLFKAAISFLEKLIKVHPRQTPITMKEKKCIDINSSFEILNEGISNSDIHIYATFAYSNNQYKSKSQSCNFDQYPNVGYIKLNLLNMKIEEMDQYTFQINVNTVIHEIIHILGFSQNQFHNWRSNQKNNQIQKVFQKNLDNNIEIYSKNIVRVTKNHFGCSIIDKINLEDQGGRGSKNSHWERDLMANEIMTASKSQDSLVTEFTTALLLDTGFFAEVNQNMVTKAIWGENQGCDFFFKTCQSNQYSHLFSNQENQEGCSYDYDGIGTFYENQYSQCKSVYKQSSCQKESQISKINQKNTFGNQSKCFVSNAAPKRFSKENLGARCFQNKCLKDGSIQIKVQESEYIYCQYPGQVIDLLISTKSSHGILRCPHDFGLICQTSQKCPINCSQNGYCINGNCICKNFYAGEDCSVYCPLAHLPSWDGYNCVSRCPIGLFRNFDNTCKQYCPERQYGDQYTGNCQLCHSNCSSCYGPSKRECTSCNKGYLLEENTCEEGDCHSSCQSCIGKGETQCTSCYKGYYLDHFEKLCKKCKSPCETCISEKECLSCNSGYIFDKRRTLQCLQYNSDNCSQIENNICKKCNTGYSLNSEKECFKCKENCKSCLKDGFCTQCNHGFVIHRFNNTCIAKCDQLCLTCEVNYPKKCLSCMQGFKLEQETNTCKPQSEDGKYLDYQQQTCKECQQKCASCINSPYQCLSCKKGFILKNGICERYCQSSCNSCQQSQDQNSFVCLKCQEGYIIQRNICTKCQSPCKSCVDNVRKCLNCINDLTYKYDQYNFRCLRR